MKGILHPQWDAPARVRSLMTTRESGDMAKDAARVALRRSLPADPAWLRQVHGTAVLDLDSSVDDVTADAAITRSGKRVCVVQVADCMPVLLADRSGTVVGAAHAGWRGLAAGVLEATLAAMRVPGEQILAWLGPAIGPSVYEVGDEVRAAFLARDEAASQAFSPTRPGHWLLDLYQVARQRLHAEGITSIHGGDLCTYSDRKRFYSYRRDGPTGRMAALIWLA
ncbi:MAG: peptidoglycan editing factor PgeF [Betaproteobacteria bacterium]|nr:MAG: peptidoglycan editing factor PgeF [Betaproteobacteria bacterium]